MVKTTPRHCSRQICIQMGKMRPSSKLGMCDLKLSSVDYRYQNIIEINNKTYENIRLRGGSARFDRSYAIKIFTGSFKVDTAYKNNKQF